MHLMKIDGLDPAYFLINEFVDSKLDDDELVDSQQQLNLHTLLS